MEQQKLAANFQIDGTLTWPYQCKYPWQSNVICGSVRNGESHVHFFFEANITDVCHLRAYGLTLEDAEKHAWEYFEKQ